MIFRRALLCLLLVGSSALATEPIRLQAGRVSMLFEPDNAFVRYVRVDDHKVLQGLSAPVRDQFWGTVPPEVKITSEGWAQAAAASTSLASSTERRARRPDPCSEEGLPVRASSRVSAASASGARVVVAA